MSQTLKSPDRSGQRGKLRIGNDWNAITIIALSQSNPLKAIAELVENIIVINNGHRDFVYAGRNKSLKLRYLVRLYSKELVLRNFVGLPPDQLLERMVELSLRTEENL